MGLGNLSALGNTELSVRVICKGLYGGLGHCMFV